MNAPPIDEETAADPTLASDYAPGIDPRAAIVSLGAVIVFALAAPVGVVAMLSLLAYTTLVYAVVAGRHRALVRQLIRLLPIGLVVVVINGLVVPGRPIAGIAGRVSLSEEGLVSGVFFALRIAVMVLALAAMLALVSPESFARAVFSFIRPVSRAAARRVAFHAFVAMSFAPLFADEIERVRLAQSFRGARIGRRRAFFRNAAAMRTWIVPLIVSAIRRSEELAAVVELRGLKSRLGEIPPAGRARPGDVAFVAVTAAVLVACRLWLGTG